MTPTDALVFISVSVIITRDITEASRTARGRTGRCSSWTTMSRSVPASWEPVLSRNARTTPWFAAALRSPIGWQLGLARFSSILLFLGTLAHGASHSAKTARALHHLRTVLELVTSAIKLYSSNAGLASLNSQARSFRTTEQLFFSVKYTLLWIAMDK